MRLKLGRVIKHDILVSHGEVALDQSLAAPARSILLPCKGLEKLQPQGGNSCIISRGLRHKKAS